MRKKAIAYESVDHGFIFVIIGGCVFILGVRDAFDGARKASESTVMTGRGNLLRSR